MSETGPIAGAPDAPDDRAMRRLSWWAIGSGLVFATLTFLAPIYLRWEATRIMSQYDAQQWVPDLMEITDEELRVPYLLTRVHCCFSVAAGILMLKRRRAGWILWVGLCVLPICTSGFDLASGSAIAAGFLRATWWAIVLWLSWTTVEKRAESYWLRAKR